VPLIGWVNAKKGNPKGRRSIPQIPVERGDRQLAALSWKNPPRSGIVNS
jgi:hypothetical protein